MIEMESLDDGSCATWGNGPMMTSVNQGEFLKDPEGGQPVLSGSSCEVRDERVGPCPISLNPQVRYTELDQPKQVDDVPICALRM
jgi:hypothetical protein